MICYANQYAHVYKHSINVLLNSDSYLYWILIWCIICFVNVELTRLNIDYLSSLSLSACKWAHSMIHRKKIACAASLKMVPILLTFIIPPTNIVWGMLTSLHSYCPKKTNFSMFKSTFSPNKTLVYPAPCRDRSWFRWIFWEHGAYIFHTSRYIIIH